MPDTSYTWNAEGYANHSSAQQKWAMELLSKLLFHSSDRAGLPILEKVDHLKEGFSEPSKNGWSQNDRKYSLFQLL